MLAEAAGRTPVLVVDDDPAILAVIERALTEEGYGVLTAADGHAALALARTHRPALVLLDCMLPAPDGAAVARTLRAWYGAGLPIVLMSASGRVREAARTLGILASLEKPFEVDALVTSVRRRLGAGSPAGTALWQAAERLLAALQERGGAPPAPWRIAAG
jgi:DNA-binding response OmpR family regulator